MTIPSSSNKALLSVYSQHLIVKRERFKAEDGKKKALKRGGIPQKSSARLCMLLPMATVRLESISLKVF